MLHATEPAGSINKQVKTGLIKY